MQPLGGTAVLMLFSLAHLMEGEKKESRRRECIFKADILLELVGFPDHATGFTSLIS